MRWQNNFVQRNVNCANHKPGYFQLTRQTRCDKPDAGFDYFSGKGRLRTPMLNSDEHAVWWQQPLTRHLALVLVVKLMLIFGLWWVFFNLPEEQEVNTGQVAAHIAGDITSPIRLDLETMK